MSDSVACGIMDVIVPLKEGAEVVAADKLFIGQDEEEEDLVAKSV